MHHGPWMGPRDGSSGTLRGVVSRPSIDRARELRSSVPLAFERMRAPVPSEMTADRCEQCDEVADRLRERVWSSLSPSEVDGLSSAIPVLSARALCGYAPAVILRGLDHPSSPAVAAFLARLASPDDPAITNDAHRRNVAATRSELVTGLRPAQLDAVRSFAAWACAHPPLRKAASAALNALTTIE